MDQEGPEKTDNHLDPAEQELKRKTKIMAEAVARVASRANEVKETGASHLDLSNCALNAFPISLYLVLKEVAPGITSITLANNELKSLNSRFFTTFTQLQELNLEGNVLKKLPDEVGGLTELKSINLAKNKFENFPESLLNAFSIENINLEDNQIKDIPLEKLSSTPSLRLVNLKGNPLNKDNSDVSGVKFEMLV
ncbi:leucine-rich repeat-containing protein 20 [Discoglossus pictus]